MEQIKRVGSDTSTHVFTVHNVDETERPVLQRNLKRSTALAFFAKLPPTTVALKACGASHHWGRELAALGHAVTLIPPQYVKPFVKRGKNDRNDAEAISEAAARPGVAHVPVKSAEQQVVSQFEICRPEPARSHLIHDCHMLSGKHCGGHTWHDGRISIILCRGKMRIEIGSHGKQTRMRMVITQSRQHFGRAVGTRNRQPRTVVTVSAPRT